MKFLRRNEQPYTPVKELIETDGPCQGRLIIGHEVYLCQMNAGHQGAHTNRKARAFWE